MRSVGSSEKAVLDVKEPEQTEEERLEQKALTPQSSEEGEPEAEAEAEA